MDANSVRYVAKIIPKNRVMGTVWRTYILDKNNSVVYDLAESFLFSVAQDRFELLKKRAEYLNLNKEG